MNDPSFVAETAKVLDVGVAETAKVLEPGVAEIAKVLGWRRSAALAARGYVVAILIVAATLPAPLAVAQDGAADDLPTWFQHRLTMRLKHRRDNPQMMRLVTPVARSVSRGVVGVIDGGRPVAIGTVVAVQPDAAGPTLSVAVVTKGSELTGGPVRIRLGDDRLMPARVAAMRREHDLKLLTYQHDPRRDGPPPVAVTLVADVPPVGSFLVSPDRTGRVIGLGVVGAAPRRVESQGKLGVQLDQAPVAGALVVQIVPGSGADSAGIERGDRIIAIDGANQNDHTMVISTLKDKYPGEVVRLTIVRNGESVNVDARLRDLSLMTESENDARVNGPRSDRLAGFDSVVQHDTVLQPDQCGGPVLDLAGRVVGLNIARAGRVNSYALPGAIVLTAVQQMLGEDSFGNPVLADATAIGPGG